MPSEKEPPQPQPQPQPQPSPLLHHSISVDQIQSIRRPTDRPQPTHPHPQDAAPSGNPFASSNAITSRSLHSSPSSSYHSVHDAAFSVRASVSHHAANATRRALPPPPTQQPPEQKRHVSAGNEKTDFLAPTATVEKAPRPDAARGNKHTVAFATVARAVGKLVKTSGGSAASGQPGNGDGGREDGIVKSAVIAGRRGRDGSGGADGGGSAVVATGGGTDGEPAAARPRPWRMPRSFSAWELGGGGGGGGGGALGRGVGPGVSDNDDATTSTAIPAVSREQGASSTAGFKGFVGWSLPAGSSASTGLSGSLSGFRQSASLWNLRALGSGGTAVGSGGAAASGSYDVLSMAGPVVGGGNEGERRQRLRLLQSLDPSSEEVIEATGALNRMFRFLRFAPGAGWGGKGMGGALVAAEDLALRNMKSYGVIRSSYKLQRQSKRQNNGKEASSQFLHFLKLLVDIRFYYNIAIEFLKSTSRVVIFMILDLVADLLFCTLYLYELQWNVSFKSEIQGKSPQFLWTPRRLPTFSIGVALTAFNIISRVLKTAFSDNKLKAFFNFSLLIDAITSYPFLIVLSIQDGHQIYIPYFLRSLIIVSRLKRVLRLRGTSKFLNFDAITEKLFLVIATILSIIYTGLCSFQYIEYNFREDGSGADLTLMDCFYFIVVTLSTVGYGDITTKTVPGQFLVIIIILVALSTIPGLIGSLVDAFTVQKSGGGYFARGTSSFVVVVGHFDTVAKIVDVMESFLDQEEGELPLKLVLMARAPASPAIKGLLNQSLYKERVTYLVGQAMDVQDLKRARIQYASATYIIADRSANSPRKEDERNTLRAWAIDEFAPLTPLFVSNLLQESEAYQEQTVTAFVCVEELKQLIIGHTTLFNGSSTFLINLVHKHSPFDSYPEVWQAQYGDGAGNEIYLSQLNAVFAGHRYVDVAWYIFKEFQTILAGIKVFVKEMNAHHHILNPGQAYILQRTDMCIFIAQSPKEIREINSLTFDEFNTSLERDASHSFVFAASSLRRRKAQIDRSVLPANANLFRVINKEGRYKTQVSQPESPVVDNKVPLCHTLIEPVTLVEAVVKSRANLIGHIVVCTGNYHVFKFVCTLRAAQLTEEDFRPIVFLCVRAPSEEEFHYFSVFPAIYFVVGDPMNKRDLHRAGIEGAHKVIIMNMSSGTADDFADGTSIMLSHLIYAMFPPPQPKKCVIIELSKRAHINFLRPSAKRRTRRSQHRKASAVVNTIAEQGLDYMYAPVFAAGRVVAATMLDCILFGLLSNSSILDIFKLFCGVRISRDVEMDKFLGITPAYLNQIDVPDAFVNRPFSEAFRELALNYGIIPLGIFRDTDEAGLGNRLPFVFTNPLPSLLLRASDLLFVLSANDV